MEFEIAIVKLTAFCNLDCRYCYMFNQADRTYEHVPRMLDAGTAVTLVERVCEHLERHNNNRFTFTLHGGEPLLWPIESFRVLLAAIAEARQSGFELSVGTQTNGLVMPRAVIELFAEHGVTLGISLDGPEWSNDSMRVGFDGRGSYSRVMRSVDELLSSEWAHLFQGFLSVANPVVPPVDFLDWAASLPLTRLDVLWPLEYHYGHTPWGRGDPTSYAKEPLYGRWFAELFEAWFRRDDPTLVIRFFYDTIMTLLGSPSHVENLVNDRVPMFVMNTDGGLEYHDFLRSYSDGGTRTPFNICTSALDDLERDPGFRWLATLQDHLPGECQPCAFKRLCGGGFLAGRCDPTSAFEDRRSVLCADEYYYFDRVHALLEPYRSGQLQAVGGLRSGWRADQARLSHRIGRPHSDTPRWSDLTRATRHRSHDSRCD